MLRGYVSFLSKVLACKLCRVVDSLVSELQSAFVGGRQILDISSIPNACIEERLRTGKSGIICIPCELGLPIVFFR